MRSQIVVLSVILALAALLFGLSFATREETPRILARDCAAVGIIAFLALGLAARTRQIIGPSASDRAPEDAARESLYAALRDIGVPKVRQADGHRGKDSGPASEPAQAESQ